MMSRKTRKALANERFLARYPWVALLGWLPPVWLIGFAFGAIGEVVVKMGSMSPPPVDVGFHEVFIWPTALYQSGRDERRQILNHGRS